MPEPDQREEQQHRAPGPQPARIEATPSNRQPGTTTTGPRVKYLFSEVFKCLPKTAMDRARPAAGTPADDQHDYTQPAFHLFRHHRQPGEGSPADDQPGNESALATRYQHHQHGSQAKGEENFLTSRKLRNKKHSFLASYQTHIF